VTLPQPHVPCSTAIFAQPCPITYDNLVYRFDKRITPFFSGWDITEINNQQVSEFLNQISEDDLTSSTISAYVRLVRKLLQHAARHVTTH